MQLHPFLLLRRTRLIAAAASSLAIVIAALFMTSAAGFRDLGVLWHHFCGCPPDPADTMILLYTPLAICCVAAFCLGLSNTNAAAGSTLKGEGLYLLTRPFSRVRVLTTPLFVAAGTLLLLPLFAWGLLLGWLALVHAPSLHHLVQLLQLLPPVARLGPHPSALQVTLAPQLIQQYLAAVSVGLCAYVVFASQRWLLLAPSNRVKLLGALLPIAIPLLPLLMHFAGAVSTSWLLLTPIHGQGFSAPSVAGIMAHLLFVVVWFMLTLYTVRRLEL